MDNLVAHYSELLKRLDGNVFEVFSKFYDEDLSPITSWLENQFQEKFVKNNSRSATLRTEGNKLFGKKELLRSSEMYTKSLCFAIPDSTEYALALANRSAVSFEMKEFHDCLKDIDMCLKTNYPKDLMPKILIRKAKCFVKLDQTDALGKCTEEISKFLKSEKVIDREKFMARLSHIENMKNDQGKVDPLESRNEIPDFPDGENEYLAYASKKVKMKYNRESGRHIVAGTNIKRGNILFIEKAFISAPFFKDNRRFYSFKCYHCLTDMISSIPCKLCTVCCYCSDICREVSWSACHRWECEGMQSNIWYNMGIALPAFRALLKGVPSGFQVLESTPEEDVNKFGDKDDNYRYFNRLLSNIYKSKNVTPYVVMGTVVVFYLKNYTDFFGWLLKQPKCPKNELSSLVKHVGAILTKHIAQLACNSSTIEHWTSSTTDLLFPDVLITIACGVFPSVSIMNHSCRPNVTNFFICDTIVVKALEDIPEGGEIFNCYGIDYRSTVREERQYTCRKFYHFECKCVICSDPNKEVDMLDSFLCPKCRGMIPENRKHLSYCTNCGEKYHLKPFRKINSDAEKYLNNQDEQTDQLGLLFKCLKIREKILCKHHLDFEEVFYRLYNYYMENGDVENMFKYFHLWLDNEKARKGSNSRCIGTKLYEAALAILQCLQNGQPKNCGNLKAFLENVEYMIKEAKIILNLYYPDFITNRLSKRIQFISSK